MPGTPSTADIRKFLTEAFNDEEFTTLCFDFFPEVADNFAAGLTKGQKIQLLLDYCQRRQVVPNLLAAIQRARPEQYEKQFPHVPLILLGVLGIFLGIVCVAGYIATLSLSTQHAVSVPTYGSTVVQTSTPVKQPTIVLPSTATPQPTVGERAFTVHANQGWQSTGLSVRKGDKIIIRYISGKWTVAYQNVDSTDPYVDADGYPRPNRIINLPLPHANDGALVGRIGTDSPFLVGNYKLLIASVEGELSLRINDDDPGDWPGTRDNQGSIDVQLLPSSR